MFLAGLPLRLFVGGGLAVAAAIPIAYSFFMMPHQQKRVLIFLDPEQDPLGAGYHITQSKIAIGSGGIFGKGFLNGTQSHLHYLPEQHTDFIFPAMVEEWGLMGGLFLILCFALIFRWGMAVALETKGRFARLTAGGLTMTIFFYFAINLLMVMGLAPVVGIPLPLFSYGGSAMLTVMICLGILMSIDRDNRRNQRLTASRQADCNRHGAPLDGGACSGAQPPCPALRHGRIAQLVEQLTLNQRVPGSSPGASTNLSMA